MEEAEIKLLVQNVSAKLKKNGGNISKCAWNDCYSEHIELCEMVSVHTQIKKFPERMMRNRAPNETKEEMDYRKDNFEPITMPYWSRAVGSINGRIWSEQNHTIDIGDEELKKYFYEDYPVYGSLIQYFRDIVTPYKINDPNAVIVLKPGEIPLVEDEQTEGGYKIDETQQLSPTLQIYGCHKVIAFELSNFALLLSDEKSKVEYNGKVVEEGLVFFLYDREYIYRIYQSGKKIEWTFTLEEVYNHALGYLPVWKLKGMPKQEVKDTKDDLTYYSYFMPSIPGLNKALKEDSTLDASVAKTAFPVRTYYEDECDQNGCTSGKIADDYDTDGKVTKWITCPKCGGSGKGGIRFSPLKDHVLRPPKRTAIEEEAPLPFPAFAYVSPDSTILTFLKDKIREQIVEAFTFINIDVSKKGDNTGSQTAIEVKIDREELFSFLLQFSSEVFDLLKNTTNALIEIRYGKDKVDGAIIINAPKTFEIYTADELTVELGEARKNGVPEIAIREMTKQYMSQRFSQQGLLPKIVEVVFNVDAYATRDTTEMAILKSNTLIATWEAVLHENIYQFIDELRAKNEDFFEWTLEKQKTELHKMARVKATELTPNTAANIVEEIAGGGV